MWKFSLLLRIRPIKFRIIQIVWLNMVVIKSEQISAQLLNIHKMLLVLLHPWKLSSFGLTCFLFVLRSCQRMHSATCMFVWRLGAIHSGSWNGMYSLLVSIEELCWSLFVAIKQQQKRRMMDGAVKAPSCFLFLHGDRVWTACQVPLQ